MNPVLKQAEQAPLEGSTRLPPDTSREGQGCRTVEGALSSLLDSLDGVEAALLIQLNKCRVVSLVGQLDPERLKILPFATVELLETQQQFPVQAVFSRRAKLQEEQRQLALSEAITISPKGFCLFQRSVRSPDFALVTICANSSNLALIRAQTRQALLNVPPLI